MADLSAEDIRVCTTLSTDYVIAHEFCSVDIQHLTFIVIGVINFAVLICADTIHAERKTLAAERVVITVISSQVSPEGHLVGDVVIGRCEDNGVCFIAAHGVIDVLIE